MPLITILGSMPDPVDVPSSHKGLILKVSSLSYVDAGIEVLYTDNDPVGGVDKSVTLNDVNGWNSALTDGSTLIAQVYKNGVLQSINSEDSTTWVDRSAVASYIIIFRFTDDVGNTTTSTRKVTIIENIKPVIVLSSPSPLYIIKDSSYIEYGASIIDTDDVVIKSNLVIDSSSVDTSTVGTYDVAYNYSGPSGYDADEVIRTVYVLEDTTSPSIDLLGDNPLDIVVGRSYIEPGFNAYLSIPVSSDVIDLNDRVIISGNVNSLYTGTYTLTYTVMDDFGNTTSVDRIVNVLSSTSIPDKITVYNERTPDTYFSKFGSQRRAVYNKDLSMSNFTTIVDKDSIIQNIYNIIFTSPGDRILNPEFGSTIYNELFDLMNPEIEGIALGLLKNDIERFESRATVDLNRSRVEIQNGNILNIYLTVIVPTGETVVAFSIEQ